jgi:Carbohydrate esterase, sialic acid-specific acetylesterase
MFVRYWFPLTLICVIALAASSATAESSGSSLPTPDEVFVLAGQSNMSGRGFPLSKGAPTNPDLLVWRKDHWEVAADPLANPEDSMNGIGPGMSFGLKAVTVLAPETLGLVQCAVRGTTISKWQPSHTVYSNCIDQVRAAGGHIDGILFLQGESDATHKSDAKKWANRFGVVLDGFRTDLGTDIPFVLGQIGKISASGFGYQKTVRSQQEQAASAHPGLTMITTSDLRMGSDGLHFTISSYKTIGSRFAKAWWQLRQAYP